MRAGSGFFLGMVGVWSFWVVGRGSGLAGMGGIDATVVGHIAAQIGRHGVRHDQDRHPEFSTLGLRHALDGRQTRIARLPLSISDKCCGDMPTLADNISSVRRRWLRWRRRKAGIKVHASSHGTIAHAIV